MATYCNAQIVYSTLLSVSPMPSSLFAKDNVKRCSYLSKIANKMAIIVVETKEHLQFFDISRRHPLLNGLICFKIRCDSAI